MQRGQKLAHDKIYVKERYAKIIQKSGNTCADNWCCFNTILYCNNNKENKHILGKEQTIVLLF
jgi:hypothetical protein